MLVLNSFTVTARVISEIRTGVAKNKALYCMFKISVPRHQSNRMRINTVDYFACVSWRKMAQKVVNEIKKDNWYTLNGYITTYVSFHKKVKQIFTQFVVTDFTPLTVDIEGVKFICPNPHEDDESTVEDNNKNLKEEIKKTKELVKKKVLVQTGIGKGASLECQVLT